MPETLWVSLPSIEENAIKEVINAITTKNLTNLSANRLIEKLENNQAENWLEILSQYNAIPSINNMNFPEMLGRTKSVTRKFRQHGYDQLENQEFPPNQLLSLVILCYSNPNLIGPKLCRALNDNNVENIKKEILENSARVGNRVAPWASNLRLVNYALYANDTSIRLPVAVINRVKNETIQNGRTIHLVDQRGGFDEWVNGTERAARGVRSVNIGPELNPYQILQSLQSDQEDNSGNGQSTRALPLNSSIPQTTDQPHIDGPAPVSGSAHNTASFSNGNDLLIGRLVGFHVLKKLPVITPVLRNIGKDLVTAGKHVGSFFSNNNSEPAEQLEQKSSVLSSVAKP